MCGICGIVNFNGEPVQEQKLREMMRTMKHRGPDDEGSYIVGNIGLGFVRLSIIDLSFAGHQPMISNDGRYVIVFNGEIYNYLEIKETLKEKYAFKSNTDTEVLLAAYLIWGRSCLEMLNGMFAFVILDTLEMSLFGARDRFGIKPFYYTLDRNRLIFASDIPPLLTARDSKPDANYSAIYDFLVFNRTNHNYETFFSNIFKLQHGHELSVSDGKVKINRWYDLREKVYDKIESDYSGQLFAADFSRSVDLQLRSDVPLGTCLSGGLDSSSITAVVKKRSGNAKLHTFSAVYGDGIQGDESHFINEFKSSGLEMHFTFPSYESLLADMERLNDAISEPLPNTSEYAEFKVMELAKEYCTVILNGQGADEIMAGYHYFFGYYFRDALKKLKLAHLTSEMIYYIALHKSMLGIKSFGFALNPGLISKINTSYLSQEFKKKYSSDSNSIIDDFYRSGNLRDFLINHFEYKFEHHLLWADKSGMYFSLETRFPFLDHHLVENTLASGITICKGQTKHLLREAMKNVLPDKIRHRSDKVGYLTPEMLWFNTRPVKEYFLDITHSDSFISREFLNKNRCRKMISDYDKTGKFSREFWKWLSLELWMRKYID